MQEIDMSERAITARLKLVSELYRLGLSLQKATFRELNDRVEIAPEEPKAKTREEIKKAV